ncbi:MAG: glycosyltransferase family 2 protein, partial [Alphaproteobacteria bacterium]|nr:glycosyltransferase family 2 protein [Alphaproteobacteria bacterium]
MTENLPAADIDVCICTFRRPHLAATLASVARQNLDPAQKIRVIVADNDDHPTARATVADAAQRHALQCTYVHAPARNISIARNACLALATAPLIAFIDDDERASPHWLAALTEALEKTGADAALGPVRAVYRPESPAWLKEGDFHSSLPVWKNGKIVSGGAGNVLLRRGSAPELRFREDLGRCGGEDTAYFQALVAAGGRIVFAEGALVTENVPEERERFLWLLRRRFRFGQTHGLLLLEAAPDASMRVKNAALAAAKAAFCLSLSLLNFSRGRAVRFWTLRGAL